MKQTTIKKNCILVGQKNDFKVYFNTLSQSYEIYKNDIFILGNKYKYRDVKTYLE